MPKRAARPLDLGFDSDTEQAPSLTRLFAASTAKESEMQRATMVEVDHLSDNPFQPRLDMDEQALDELAQVMKLQGFQGVLVARPTPLQDGNYQLTAGHRRREAARRAGLRVLPVVIQDLSDEEMVVRAITENIQREDLSPLEEGKIYLLMSEEMDYTYAQIAKEVGKTVSYVRNRLGVARGPEDVQILVQKKPDTLRAVIYLSKVEDPTARTNIIEQILGGSLTTDDLPAYIEALRSEEPEQPPAQLPLASPEVLTEPTMVQEQEHVAYTAPDVVKPEEAVSTDVGKAADPSSQAIAEGALVTPPARLVQIDGVSTSLDRTPEGAARQSIADYKRTQLRVRGSKLTSALRTLVTYENMLADGPGLLPDEIGRLIRISSVVGGILTRNNQQLQNESTEK